MGLHTEAVRRLTNNTELGAEFATSWRDHDLDQKTKALLNYAEKLTNSPGQLEENDFDTLKEAGWDDEGIYEATLLVSLFNFSGRLEAASGLPQDEYPEEAQIAEAMA